MRAIFIILLSATFLLLQTGSASAQILTTEKLITVDIGKQMLYAWEGGKIINQTPVSTGMWLTPTVKGSFKIGAKYPKQDMRGPSPYKQTYPTGRYYIKDVPNVMYFYQAYAFHAATWHNNFGRRASHGCVNVPPVFSQWLYDFAAPGTRVEIF